jgi:hypothetical protein
VLTGGIRLEIGIALSAFWSGGVSDSLSAIEIGLCGRGQALRPTVATHLKCPK